MVRFALLSFALVTCLFCRAQTPLAVDHHFYERRYKFKQTVQTGANEFTVIQGRRDWFFYSSRLFLSRHLLSDGSLNEKRIVLTAHNQPAYLVHAFARDGALLFVCLSPYANRQELGWSVFRFDLNAGQLTNVVEPQPQNGVPYNVALNGYINIALSADSTKAAVCFTHTGADDNHETVYALTLDLADTKRFKTARLQAHDPITQFERIKFLLDGNGQLFTLGKQFLNGSNEVTKGKANYAYVLMGATDSGFKTQCTVPDHGSILRSFDAVLVGDTLFGSGLASDSTLALNDTLVTLQMNWRDHKMLMHRAAPLKNPPSINAAFANRFDNTIRRVGDETVSTFELQHIAFNESTRPDHGFMYQRGLTMIAVTKAQAEPTVTRVEKWQQFLAMPENALALFARNGIWHAAFIDYNDNDQRNNLFSIVNVNNRQRVSFTIPFDEWQKNTAYEMFVTARGVVALQADGRKYHYVIAPLP